MVEAINDCIENVCGDTQVEFHKEVSQVLKNAEVCEKLFQELVRFDLVGYEKKLGSGTRGSVYQVDGGKLFPK